VGYDRLRGRRLVPTHPHIAVGDPPNTPDTGHACANKAQVTSPGWRRALRLKTTPYISPALVAGYWVKPYRCTRLSGLGPRGRDKEKRRVTRRQGKAGARIPLPSRPKSKEGKKEEAVAYAQ